MNSEKFSSIFSFIKAPIDHPLFYARVFALVARSRRLKGNKKSDIELILTEEYDDLSRRLDQSAFQESCSVRNILRARHLAIALIDDKGDLNVSNLSLAIETLREHLYSLGPNRQYDAKRQEHLLKILEHLNKNKELVRLLKKMSRPFSNKQAEELIRDTLQLSSTTQMTDAHARRAVLSAWISYLRQNVGSCFATAPAKVVQEEQPELFLQDMHDLIATGRLKRTFGGIEYSVPLSMSWGGGDLKKPIMMHYSTQGVKPEIWYSPGLVAAFESVHFLKKEESYKQKVSYIRDWITPLIQQKSTYQSYFFITAEEIIRFIMLQLSGLKEQDIKDYENRPRHLIQSQLLLQSPISKRSSNAIGERCANFLAQFEIAKNTFKGLSDNALLKAWEFTLASFSESKFEFTNWNLYSSLGMGTNEPGGIGQCIYQVVQQKLELINREIEQVQPEYEMVYTQVKTLESRMRQSLTEKEAQWLKLDYQTHMHEFYVLEEHLNHAQYQAKMLVGLYESLYRIYLNLFKEYFQEVYDADVQEIITGPFDDSPAGFRLLYKHGRSHSSQWTKITNHTEFIDALASFFVATEPQIAATLELKKMEKDLSEIITAIINHIKTKEFIESAFYRMAIAHQVPPIKDPLDHLDRIEKKPWVYTSGGTMNTLMSCYYCLPDKPKEEEKWVESEVELIVFLVDAMKHMPTKFLSPYLKKTRASLLMQSPTHAFILKPMLPLFKEAWLNENFTYTFVRDQMIKPAESLIENISLDDDMIRYLVQALAQKVPENFQPRFKSVFFQLMGPLNPFLFREYLVDTLFTDRGLQYGKMPVLRGEEIDSLLHSHLPLFPIDELKDRLSKILILLPGINQSKLEEILSLFDQLPLSRNTPIMSAYQLQEICKALICLSGLATTSPQDYHLAVSLAAQELGLALPMPLIFADTNWSKDEFGFVVNPGTGKVELWRIDYTGRIGYPMTDWKEWLDGSRTDRTWGVYVKPSEYGQS